VLAPAEKSPAGRQMAWRIAAGLVVATALAAVLAIDWQPLAVLRQSEGTNAASKTSQLPSVPTAGAQKAVNLSEVGRTPAPN
jgi:hypothetical protein